MPGLLCWLLFFWLIFSLSSFASSAPFSRVILISLSKSLVSGFSDRQRERGTTRCPCWQRCIKMSHPICRAHLPASKGGSSIPPFFPLQCSEVSPSLARLLLLKARLALNGGEGSTDSAIPAGDGKRSETECLNNLGYLYEHYLWNISAFFFLPLYIWDEIIYFYFISLALCILHRALFRRLIRFPENQLWICFVSSVVDWCF